MLEQGFICEKKQGKLYFLGFPAFARGGGGIIIYGREWKLDFSFLILSNLVIF